jgi:hypothetical protein
MFTSLPCIMTRPVYWEELFWEKLRVAHKSQLYYLLQFIVTLVNFFLSLFLFSEEKEYTKCIALHRSCRLYFICKNGFIIAHLPGLIWDLWDTVIKIFTSWVPVADTCNPSYSGGRDQEDVSSKPAPGKYFAWLCFENIQYKTGLVEWLKW